MQLNVRGTWGVVLLSFTAATFAAGAGRVSAIEENFATIYIVGAHGYLEKWEGCERMEHLQLPGISRRLKMCTQSFLSPNGETLVIFVATDSCPLRLVKVQDMREVDLPGISFPNLPSRLSIHEPLGLYMPTDDFVLLTDVTYTACEPPFSDMMVNLITQEALPLPSIHLPVTRLGQMAISPACDTEVYAVTPGALKVFDLESRSITRSVDFSLDGWSDLHEITFDWTANQVYVVLTNHVEDSAETLRLDIDLDALEVTKAKTQNPWLEYDVEDSSAVGQLVRTYDRGYDAGTGKDRRLPLIDARLRIALQYLTEEMAQELPFKPDSMFLSPDGRFMVCSRMYSEAIDDTDFVRFLGEWVLVDVHSGKILVREHYPEEITSVTFAPQT